jgi:hypothetical protein
MTVAAMIKRKRPGHFYFIVRETRWGPTRTTFSSVGLELRELDQELIEPSLGLVQRSELALDLAPVPLTLTLSVVTHMKSQRGVITGLRIVGPI